jgi:signal transduction histidine kinase
MYPLTSFLIPRWFAPPDLSHPHLRRGARALWMMSWPFVAVVALLLGFAVLVEPDTLGRRAVTVGSVAVVVTGLHWLSRTGRPTLASWLLVTALSVIVTQRAWITGGIHAPVAVFYALFVLMGGVLLGRRGAVVTAAVCLAGSIVLATGSLFELAAPRAGAGPESAAFIFALLAIALALVVHWAVTAAIRVPEPGFDAVRMLVHDMRSPLHIVMAHLEMLREDIAGDSCKDVHGALSGASRLHRMINSLLDAGRLEAGRMPLERSLTDVSQLAAAVVDELRVLQPGRAIEFECLGDCRCVCDRELIRRVIENLVSNAIKHTHVDGSVRVELSGTRRLLRIRVQDEGVGVPAEHIERIFEPYVTTATAPASQFESSGVGLAFCRLAVEAHGGTIRVENAVPHGAIFVVELPRQSPDADV